MDSSSVPAVRGKGILSSRIDQNFNSKSDMEIVASNASTLGKHYLKTH